MQSELSQQTIYVNLFQKYNKNRFSIRMLIDNFLTLCRMIIIDDDEFSFHKTHKSKIVCLQYFVMTQKFFRR